MTLTATTSNAKLPPVNGYQPPSGNSTSRIPMGTAVATATMNVPRRGRLSAIQMAARTTISDRAATGEARPQSAASSAAHPIRRRTVASRHAVPSAMAGVKVSRPLQRLAAVLQANSTTASSGDCRSG